MCHPFHHVITDDEVDGPEENRSPSASTSEVPTAKRPSRRFWLQSIIAGGAAVFSILKVRDAQAVQVTASPPPGTVTTQALGEEGGISRPPRQPPITTQALGEEGGSYPPPANPPMTTQALGEEGGNGYPPGRVTTFALGEEGSGYYQPPYVPSPPRYRIPRRYYYPSDRMTTYALGEEGAGYRRFP